ncbi:AChain A, Esterase Domain Of The Zfl2-1 Orf1 Protein From The Zebrafish Zfl2-1 Retrotransposon, partial [Clarias magur]
EDTLELHSADLEMEALEKQIRDLQVKLAQLRQRKATFTCPRSNAPRTQPAQVSFTPAPGYHEAWIQQQRKTRTRPRARTSPPPPPPVFEIPTRNHFAPLRETVPAALRENFGAVVLHAGTNDTRLRQREILKKDFRSLVEKVRSTSSTTRIIVYGLLPTFQRGIE